MVAAAEESIKNEVASIQKLSEAASKYPYYKYNGMWTRQVQDAVSIFLSFPFLLILFPLLGLVVLDILLDHIFAITASYGRRNHIISSFLPRRQKSHP